MSHSFPIAPPPPKPYLQNNENKTSKPTIFNPSSKNLIDDCLWAQQYPELQKACYLARVCELKAPLKCQYYNIESILQEGPTCGLTALSMLFGGKITTKELLAIAKERRFSYNGEIFSARYLFEILCDTAEVMELDDDPILADNLEINFELHRERLNEKIIIDYLQYGSCLLVPYDPDFNHAPCVKYGRKAHWALVIGYLISDKGEFYVIARHGKAKNLAVWSLNALSESNANLIQFAQPKGYPNCDFLLPSGGIGGENGLKERAIIVKKVKHERINVR